MLAVAPLLTAAGYALWVFAPSYPTFALGFALWGAQGALQSGALEALVYEELERAGAAARYPAVMGRATALGTLAAAVAMGVAAPVLASTGFTGVGMASIAAALASAAVGTTLPEHRAGRSGLTSGDGGADEGDAEGDRPAGIGGLLRTSCAFIAWRPAVRAAVLLVAAVTAIWGSLDEYLPLLAVEAGAPLATVPALGLIVYAGMVLGGLAAGRAARLTPRGLAAVLVASAGLLAAGSLSRAPTGFVAIALAFGGFQALTVAVDARLQAAIEGDARSTITSLAGFATEIVVLAVFAAYAAGSGVAGHATLFACFAALHLPVALWLWRSPRRTPAAVEGS